MPTVEVPLTGLEDIPREGSKVVEFFGRELHVVWGKDGVPAAFMNVCVHFGGTLTCARGQFVCQWHGATFDASDGHRTGGPAADGSSLMLLPTVVREGMLTYVFTWEDATG